MRRGKAESVGDVLRKFLRQEGIETPLNQFRAIQMWNELLGPGIAPYTGKVYIKNQSLYVEIKSPALKGNLMMERERLIQRLNEAVGAQVINRIIFC